MLLSKSKRKRKTVLRHFRQATVKIGANKTHIAFPFIGEQYHDQPHRMAFFRLFI